MKQKKNTKRELTLEDVVATQREILTLVDRRFTRLEGKTDQLEGKVDRLEGKVDTMFNMVADMHEIIVGELGKKPGLLDQVHDLGERVERIEKQLAKRA